ncbi:MAG: S8 family serine peptidase [Deltaproteobacteria bacterium]|nr:S8 family serine peptidase [Deltaproteobacteria bacterium]
MRYLGKEFTGKGLKVAVIDSGVDIHDPRLKGAEIEGWQISLGATRHALISQDFTDQNGHGTEIAAAILAVAPGAKIVAVKIMGDKLRTSAELMAAGIETAARNGCKVINLSLGTPNMGNALLLRDCCANAVESGSVVLAAAHPKGERAYPADLPETIGVAAHPDCPLDKFFYFDPKRFPRKEWGVLSDKFLAHGYGLNKDGTAGRYRGSGIATAYLAGTAACLGEALAGQDAEVLMKALRRAALIPIPEIGYS